MSLVAILGATGTQGGGVVETLLKSPKWSVRAITRNLDSEQAKALKAKGAEVVAADANDEASLIRAFKGATAIFAVTAFWPSAFKTGVHAAGDEEVQQLKNIFTAASKAGPDLQNLVLSSLPAAQRASGGKFHVPHYDYKEVARDWAERNYPEVLAKTTMYWPGWYVSNMVNYPIYRPIRVPAAGGYLLAVPSRSDGVLPVTGDAAHNTGVIVEAVLDAGPRAHGKTVVAVTDWVRFADVAAEVGRVLGSPCAYAELSDEGAEVLWGPIIGGENARQLRWSEEYPDWYSLSGESSMSFAELGVEGRLVGFQEALNGLNDQIM